MPYPIRRPTFRNYLREWVSICPPVLNQVVRVDKSSNSNFTVPCFSLEPWNNQPSVMYLSFGILRRRRNLDFPCFYWSRLDLWPAIYTKCSLSIIVLSLLAVSHRKNSPPRTMFLLDSKNNVKRIYTRLRIKAFSWNARNFQKPDMRRQT